LRGGLFDIDFVAQYLALRHAAEKPEILDVHPAEVLRHAAGLGVLDPVDAERLRAARGLMSDVQSLLRLTLNGDESSFDESKAPEGQRRLIAQTQDVPDIAALRARLAEETAAARAIYEKIIDAPARAAGWTGRETCATDGGGKLKLSELRGKPVVLYFYPKDDTPGCTTEACGFRDSAAAFKKLKAQVIGVSKDSVARHDKFKAKYQLDFPLVSDEDGKICEKYGTWIEKSLYGRKYMGIDRATFLIDKDGVVAKIWRKVKVKGHVDEVAEALKAL
jgi:peroxiredoxin